MIVSKLAMVLSLCVTAAVGLVTYLVFRTAAAPTGLLFLAGEVLVACAFVRREWIRNAALAAGVLLLMLVAADIYLRMTAAGQAYRVLLKQDYHGRAFGVPRDEPEGVRAINVENETGATIYDVTYTLDRFGHRQTGGGGPGADTYLFFGDSFTYGEGLSDSETLPSQFVESMGRRVTAVNLAFHGFGPQQMLRQIETGAFEPSVTGPVKGAVYLAIADHGDRAVGSYYWQMSAPRYVLDDAGEPQHTGTFSDNLPAWILNRMDLARGLPRLLARAAWTVLVPPGERIALAAAIIDRSAKLLADKYGVNLLVLLWDERQDIEPLTVALRQRGLDPVMLSSVLGDLTSPRMHIRLPMEIHPSALADREIAAWLAARVKASRIER